MKIAFMEQISGHMFFWIWVVHDGKDDDICGTVSCASPDRASLVEKHLDEELKPQNRPQTRPDYVNPPKAIFAC